MMELKELQAAFIRDYKADKPRYCNYMIAELPNGRVEYICMCDGHNTMEEAMVCHDMADSMNAVRAFTLDGKLLPVHNVIVKELQVLEFLEE